MDNPTPLVANISDSDTRSLFSTNFTADASGVWLTLRVPQRNSTTDTSFSSRMMLSCNPDNSTAISQTAFFSFNGRILAGNPLINGVEPAQTYQAGAVAQGGGYTIPLKPDLFTYTGTKPAAFSPSQFQGGVPALRIGAVTPRDPGFAVDYAGGNTGIVLTAPTSMTPGTVYSVPILMDGPKERARAPPAGPPCRGAAPCATSA